MDFDYRCIDSSGKSFKGRLVAGGTSEAKTILKERGLTIVEIAVAHVRSDRKIFPGRSVKDTDLYNMFRELSILLKSGIKIDRAMEILVNTVSAGALKEDIASILKDIKAGKSLSQAFADTGRFNLLTVTMIRAGESVGDLRSAFENIAESQRFNIQFRSEIKNALTYPSFLIFASFFTILIIFKFIIPRFFSIFGKNEASLPATAKILYSIGNLLSFANFYGIIVVGVVIIFILKLKLVDTKKILARGYSSLVRVPLMGSLIIYLELSRFSYSMYSMLNSGIEFINALKLSIGIVQSMRLRESMEPAVYQIQEGKGIADTFSQISLLPDLVHNMLRVGEESGNLKEVFYELHRIFDERFKNSTKRVLALVEPMVITFTGIIVGFIVISLILTVMSASDIKL